MTKAQLMEQITKGRPLLVVEYRGREVEDRNWRDGETKQPRTGTFGHDNIELGGKQVKLKFRVPEGMTASSPELAKLPAAKGSLVVLNLRTLESDRTGNLSATGTLEPLE